MPSPQQQFIRRVNLVVSGRPFTFSEIPDEVFGTGNVSDPLSGIDLSELHFKFAVRAGDVPQPNNASIRVYNLSADTLNKILGKEGGVEFSRVQLLAGYRDAVSAIIFDGTIKQFRYGHESMTDSYLDILAADSDLGYNFGVCNDSLEAGANSPHDQARVAAEAMDRTSREQIQLGNVMDFTGGVLPRGRVLFGMARDVFGCIASTQKATWSIQNGNVNIIPLQSFLPGDPVELTSATGLIGYPEQTDQGILIRCLLNPTIDVGGRVRINNKAINLTTSQLRNVDNIAFDQWTAIQYLASVSNDGVYRVYVIDHVGDTRGQEFYSELTCLAIDRSKQSTAYPDGIVLANR